MNTRLPAPARREQILDVSVTVFARNGFHGTSMNDVAEAAGMERIVVLQLLSEGADKEAVAREHAMAVQGGVTGVPFAIFAGKVAVVGAETPERIAEAIDQALTTGA